MKIKNLFRFIFFIIVYSASCLTISTNRFSGYFSYTTTINLLAKFCIIFIFVFIAVLINKQNEKQVIAYSSVFINIVLLLYIFDFYVTQISGNNIYYRMWWLSAIFIAQAALFTGGRIMGYNHFSKKFWLSFLPTYIFTFILIFIRKPFTYFEVNLKIGDGVFSTIDYLISHFKGNTWPLFNLVGNVVYFVPLPFFVKTIFGRLKNSSVLFISLIVPFFIEGYQYILKCGSVDIDDIVLNLSGVIIGFLIFLMDNKRDKVFSEHC